MEGRWFLAAALLLGKDPLNMSEDVTNVRTAAAARPILVINVITGCRREEDGEREIK